MTGILIPKMKEPKECRDCPLCTFSLLRGTTECLAKPAILSDHYRPIPFDGRPAWCPIVYVEIDEDDLK